MTENDKSLIDAVAAIYDRNPEYTHGLIDGLRVASNAMGSLADKMEKQADEEEEAKA